jgi:hypothetical protein
MWAYHGLKKPTLVYSCYFCSSFFARTKAEAQAKLDAEIKRIKTKGY